jgi:putative salt-induced outer membrane protein
LNVVVNNVDCKNYSQILNAGRTVIAAIGLKRTLKSALTTNNSGSFMTKKRRAPRPHHIQQFLRYFLFAAASAISASASAQEIVEQPWRAAIELGAISTTGNTETLSIQSKIDITQELERWQNQYVASVLFKKDEITQADGTETTEKTAEKYFLSAQSAYKLEKEDSKLFVIGSYTQDQFGAFEQYTTASFGYGSRWLDRPDMQLDAEFGPGYFRGERVTEVDTIEIESGFMVRGALKFLWLVSESAAFAQNISVESGSDNTRTISETSLTTTISDTLQMKVGYSIFHDTDVASDKEKMDTTTFINLVYNL